MKAVYESKKEKNEGFEVIYCSWDKQQSDFDGYFKDMPWKAIPFQDAKKIGDAIQVHLKTKINSIPTLLMVDPKLGVLLEKDGRSRIHDYQQELAMAGDKRQLLAHTAVKKLHEGIDINMYVLNDVNEVEQRSAVLKYVPPQGDGKSSQGKITFTESAKSKDGYVPWRQRKS